MTEDLSSEQRRALYRIAQTSSELGAWLGPNDVPRGTAAALARRGLVEIDGSRVRLTETGKVAAAEVAEKVREIMDRSAP